MTAGNAPSFFGSVSSPLADSNDTRSPMPCLPFRARSNRGGGYSVPARRVSVLASMRPFLASRWARAVPSLRESALRASYMKSELNAHALDVVATALDELCARAEQ